MVWVVLAKPFGWYGTEHLEVALVSGDRVHMPPAGVNAPCAPELEKVTVPPGDDAVPPAWVSVTVAVQVVVFQVGRVDGLQLTDVLVDRVVIVNAELSSGVKVPLVACS
jgi:hypothetical protein